MPALPRASSAQDYPSKPITMIVPYAAGGPTDTVGRVVTERMRAELGQTIVAENVGGAGGSIGLGRLARAAPDGYTINVGNWSAHVVNGAIYSLPYDLKTDFEPIALLALAPQIVVSRKSIPANDLKGLIAWIKTNGEKATFGTAGGGSPPHVGAALFQSMTGTKGAYVPYRGNALALQDLVAGQIDIVVSDPTTATPQIKAGTIKAYAVAASTRLPALSEVPTSAEAGLPGFEVDSIQAVFGRAGTPSAIINRLNQEMVRFLRLPETREKLLANDVEAVGSTPEELAAVIKSEMTRLGKVIKAYSN